MLKIDLIKEDKPNHYKLYSDCTIYADFHKATYFELDLNAIKEERKQLKKELRLKGVKVKTKTNDEIFKRLFNDFYIKLGEYKAISEDLINKFNAIYENGLYAPTSDNEALNEAERISFKLQELNYRSSSLSIFKEIKTQVDNLKLDLKRGTTFIEVSL